MIKLALAVLLAVPASAARKTEVPAAEELVLRALAPRAAAYAAVERVQVFRPGAKPKSMSVRISGLPGGKTRREIAGRNKKPGPVELRAEDESAEKGLARLRSLYELSASTGGVVAKRRTWKIELRLKSNGVLRRALWVSRDDGFLMKRETYRDDGSLARRERLTKLELPVEVDPALFAGAAPKRPWMPCGFVAAGDGVYTNGLERYTVKDGRATGDLAEDDAERVAGR